MPQITARVTWYFSAPQGYGWTENFYMSAPDLPTAFALITQARINLRLNMLAPAFTLNAIKLTDVTPPLPGQPPTLRKTLLWPQTNGIGTGQYSAIPASQTLQGSGEPYQALVIRMEAGIGNRRPFLMRGIPDEITDAGGNYSPTATWLDAFRAWSNDISKVGTPFGLRVVSAGPVLTPVSWTILQGGLNVSLSFLAASDPLWQNGQIVRVAGSKGAAFLNGYWKTLGAPVPVVVGGLNTMQYFLRPKKRAVCGTPTNVPTVAAVNPGFLSFTAAYAERGAKKATGRPIGPSRGRARVRTA